ncbi:hypothetical protein [Tepidicella baoligensis]|nr:hypothetical protein [Tepidicella baoligensis]
MLYAYPNRRADTVAGDRGVKAALTDEGRGRAVKVIDAGKVSPSS